MSVHPPSSACSRQGRDRLIISTRKLTDDARLSLPTPTKNEKQVVAVYFAGFALDAVDGYVARLVGQGKRSRDGYIHDWIASSNRALTSMCG